MDSKQTSRQFAGNAPYVIVWLDFNTPHTRDSTKLQKLCEMLHFILSRSPLKSVAVVWMPDFPKDATTLDMEHHTILTELSKLKLDALAIQCNIRWAILKVVFQN